MRYRRAAVVSVMVAVTAVGSGLVLAGTFQDEPRPVVEPPATDSTTPSGSATATTDPDPQPIQVPARLLPNLRSLPPEDVSIEIVDGGVRRLRFASIIANTGVGPVETMPDDAHGCPDGQRHASQVIYHDADGDDQFSRGTDRTTSVRPGGCVLDHPSHDHWHFDAAASYGLTPVGSGAAVVTASKVSFCWRDNRQVPAEATPRPAEFYGDCTRDTDQGISPGWADVYDAQLPDQHLDLPADLPDGTYCLRNQADPLDLLLERNDEDNAAALAVRITGQTVTPADASCSATS